MIDAADELTVRFRSPEFAEAFRSSYDAALRRWPGDVTALDLPGPYGTTHVNTCGPAGAAAPGAAARRGLHVGRVVRERGAAEPVAPAVCHRPDRRRGPEHPL